MTTDSMRADDRQPRGQGCGTTGAPPTPVAVIIAHEEARGEEWLPRGGRGCRGADVTDRAVTLPPYRAPPPPFMALQGDDGRGAGAVSSSRSSSSRSWAGTDVILQRPCRGRGR